MRPTRVQPPFRHGGGGVFAIMLSALRCMVAAATTAPSNMRAAAAIKDRSIPWEDAPQAASITRWTIGANTSLGTSPRSGAGSGARRHPCWHGPCPRRKPDPQKPKPTFWPPDQSLSGGDNHTTDPHRSRNPRGTPCSQKPAVSVKLRAAADRTGRGALYRALGLSLRYETEAPTGRELRARLELMGLIEF